MQQLWVLFGSVEGDIVVCRTMDAEVTGHTVAMGMGCDVTLMV